MVGTMMVALNGLPPDPELFGEGWEEEWERRLQQNTPYMLNWLANQTDGAYWRPGSLRGQYDRIRAATLIIGGWQDGYPNPLLRAYQHLGCRKKLLVGPWNHSRPDVAIPGPRIHYLNEMRRWFDLTLKDEDDGISREPPITFFVQSHDMPDPGRRDTTGEWRSEQSWPADGASSTVLYLGSAAPAGGRALSEKPVVSENSPSLVVDPTTGVTGGLWSGGLPFGLAGDQRPDESRSLVWTSSPLKEQLLVAGNPVLYVRVSSSSAVAMFVVKISDVAPDGASALICRGILNGTRRGGMSDPEPMTPGDVYGLQIELDATAWRLRRGHRLRLSISGSDFPNSWPTPEQTTITVHTGGAEQSRLDLPILTDEGLPAPRFEPPPVRGQPDSVPEPDEWSFTEHPLDQTVTLRIHRGADSQVRDGVSFYGSDDLTLIASRCMPGDVQALGISTSRMKHHDRVFESVAEQEIKSDATHLHWRVRLTVHEDGRAKLNKTWKRDFPRELL